MITKKMLLFVLVSVSFIVSSFYYVEKANALEPLTLAPLTLHNQDSSQYSERHRPGTLAPLRLTPLRQRPRISANEYDFNSFSNEYGFEQNPYRFGSLTDPYGLGDPYRFQGYNNPYAFDSGLELRLED